MIILEKHLPKKFFPLKDAFIHGENCENYSGGERFFSVRKKYQTNKDWEEHYKDGFHFIPEEFWDLENDLPMEFLNDIHLIGQTEKFWVTLDPTGTWPVLHPKDPDEKVTHEGKTVKEVVKGKMVLDVDNCPSYMDIPEEISVCPACGTKQLYQAKGWRPIKNASKYTYDELIDLNIFCRNDRRKHQENMKDLSRDEWERCNEKVVSYLNDTFVWRFPKQENDGLPF